MKLEPLHLVQIQRFRQMTPVEKWNVALGLLGTARATRRAALRAENPKLTEAEIERALAKELAVPKADLLPSKNNAAMKTKRHPGCGHLITIGWLHPDPEPQRREGKQMDDNSQPVA